jgi:hypothetical protein
MSSYEFKQLISSNDTESNSIILGSIATYEHIYVLVKKQNRKGKKSGGTDDGKTCGRKSQNYETGPDVKTEKKTTKRNGSNKPNEKKGKRRKHKRRRMTENADQTYKTEKKR